MRLIRFATALAAAVVLCAAVASAQDVQVTPTEYSFTMTKMELCTSSTCAATTVLGTKTQVFDIGSAQVSAGAQVGSYLQSIELELETTYTHVRVTLNRTFSMTGGTNAGVTSNANGGSCYTDSTASGTAGTGTAYARTTDSGASGRGSAASSMSIMVPDVNSAGDFGDLTATFSTAGIVIVDATTMTVTIALTSPYTVTARAPTFVISFDVASTLNFTGAGADTCVIWFTPPNVSITIT
jgi:hypothetical protein